MTKLTKSQCSEKGGVFDKDTGACIIGKSTMKVDVEIPVFQEEPKTLLQKIRDAFNWTPKLIELSHVFEEHPTWKWMGVFMFLSVGLLGAFLPVFQGSIGIILAIGLLGLPGLTEWIQSNQGKIVKISNVILILGAVPIFYGLFSTFMGFNLPGAEAILSITNIGKAQTHVVTEAILGQNIYHNLVDKLNLGQITEMMTLPIKSLIFGTMMAGAIYGVNKKKE